MDSLSPVIRIIRSDRNLGLIRARHLGISHATGEVIVVMDSHMEVQIHW